MDKAQAKQIHVEAGAAVEAVLAKYGLKLAKTRASYDPDGMIRLTFEGHGSGDADPKVADWKRYAEMWRLPVNALGTTIIVGGVSYRIEGMEISRRRFPVSVSRVQDNKPMLLTVEAVRGALKVEAL